MAWHAVDFLFQPNEVFGDLVSQAGSTGYFIGELFPLHYRKFDFNDDFGGFFTLTDLPMVRRSSLVISVHFSLMLKACWLTH
jgi:hypothetical protein